MFRLNWYELMKIWKVIIVDNHPISRSGLKLVLGSYNFFKVIGESSNGDSGVLLCSKLQPDIVLMDINMPHMNGIEATIQLRRLFADMIIIAFSGYLHIEMQNEAFKAGANGYISKEEDFETIVEQILTIANHTVLPVVHVRNNYLFNLTATEQKILTLLAEGLNRQQVADELKVSLNTVKMHLKSLYAKLQVHNSSEAISIALKYQLIP